MFQRELYNGIGALPGSDTEHQQNDNAPQYCKTVQIVLSASACLASDFVISWWCHAAGLSVAFPLDTLRIRSIAEQTGAGVAISHRSLSNIVHNDGYRTLYTGITVPMLTKGPLLGAAYCLNEALRAALLVRRQKMSEANSDSRKSRRGMFRQSQQQLSLVEALVAGGLSGGAIAFFQCPIHTLQVTHQLSTSNAYLRAVTGLTTQVSPRDIYLYFLSSSNGFRSLFCGLKAELAIGAISRAAHFGLYDMLQASTVAYWRQSSGKSTSNNDCVTVSQKVVAAALSGAVSWACIYPIEVVRVHLQAERASQTFSSLVCNSNPMARDPSYQEVIKRIYSRCGVRGFWIGWHLAVMRTVVTSAVALPLFDTIRTNIRGRYAFNKQNTSRS